VDIKRAPQSKKKQYIAWAAGIVAIVAVSVGISKLKPAAPSVDRATLWVDSVRQGELLREVRAAGTLVPERVRIISAQVGGRIEQLPLRPGVTVNPSTVLIEMSNVDIELQALQAEQSLTQARSGLAQMRTNLLQARLAQEGAIASLRTQLDDARRQLTVVEALDAKKLASGNELTTAKDRVRELEKREQIERDRLIEMNRSADEQIALNVEQVNRLGEIVREQKNRKASMRVLAGDNGVLQSLGQQGIQLELGQFVNAGTELARVSQPGKLKAVIRVPETQARDIAVGQKATVDTRNGIVPGRVMRIDPASTQGTVTVEIALEGELPRGARADMSVDGTIELERLANVKYVGRPAFGSAESTVGLFKITADGKEAESVPVKLGRTSVNTVEILNGLNVGDSVIISDMTAWDNYSRVRLKR
jgi:HlyD family secretion protein